MAAELTERERVAWFAERMGNSAPPEHPGTVAAREHNEALQRGAEVKEQWVRYCSMSPPHDDLGDLEALRTACGLSQGDVAQIAAIDVGTVVSVEENGGTSPSYADNVLRQVAGGLQRRIAEGDGA